MGFLLLQLCSDGHQTYMGETGCALALGLGTFGPMEGVGFLLGRASQLYPSPREQVEKRDGAGVGGSSSFSCKAGASPALLAPPEPF